jgi:hypothetical protein
MEFIISVDLGLLAGAALKGKLAALRTLMQRLPEALLFTSYLKECISRKELDTHKRP